MTAAADATSRVGAVRRRARLSTASPSVSGTAAACTAAPDCGVRASSPMAARNSSTCSGMPSLRSWIAATSWAGTGRPSVALVMVAVWSRPRRGSRTSSASRWASRRARRSRMGRPGIELVAAVRARDQHRPVASRPARWPSTSRLSSSAQCRSSRTISTGVPGSAVTSRSARSCTSRRRRWCASPASAGIARIRDVRLWPRSPSAGSGADIRSLARSSSRPPSDCTSPGNAAARTTAKPLALGAPRDRAEQPGLADARLARHEQHPASARCGVGEPALHEGEESVPADQNR